MTSQFDDMRTLAGYWQAGRIPEDLRGEVRAVVEIAVQQAGEHEPDWNFETYLKKQRGLSEKAVDEFFGFEMAAKFKFLDETHDFLDHGMDNGKYHCRVFSGALRIRMKHLYQALGDRGLYFL